MQSLYYPFCFFFVVYFMSEVSLMAQVCAPFEYVEHLTPCPEPVSNNAVCKGYANGKRYVYSFGGIDSTKGHEGIHKRSWRYDIDGDTWENLPALPDSTGKIAMAASYLDGVIYIIGGYHVLSNGSEKSSVKIHRFDCASNTFLSDGANLPVAIDDHVQSIWNDSLIMVLTGWSNSGNVAWLQLYNPKTDTWLSSLQLWNFPVFNSFGAAGSIVGDTLLYLGGASSNGSFPIQSYLRKGIIDPLDPTQISWTYESIDPNHSLYRSSSLALDGSVLWLGGSTNTYNYDGIAYDGSGGVPPSSSIVSVQNQIIGSTSCPQIPMDLRGAGWFPEHGDLFIVGGMTENQQVSDALIKLHAGTLSVNEPQPSTLRIYPNPTSGQIHLSSDESMKVSIFQIDGRQIGQFNVNSSLTIDLPNGMYLMQWKSSNDQGTERVIVQ